MLSSYSIVITCKLCAIDSLSVRISDKAFVPRIFRKLVAANKRVEYWAFATYIYIYIERNHLVGIKI
jgi:hypothetical protein